MSTYHRSYCWSEKNRDRKKNGGEANELRQKTDNGDSCKSRSPSHQTEAIEKDE